MGKLIEPWFFFALVWSVGGTCDGDSRQKFDRFLRNKMQQVKVAAVCCLCVGGRWACVWMGCGHVCGWDVGMCVVGMWACAVPN